VTEPVEPRPAATLVLLRPGRSGPEVLLGQRPPSMAFAPDVHVFPGGRVDSADAHPSLVARSAISPEQAAAALGGDVPPTRAISKYIAAIREAFEEAGVLLADTGDVSAATVRAARNALVGGEIHFQALAAQLDLHLRTDLLVSLSRWVTPPSMPRRFDARFFVAALPDGATASLYGDEVVEQAWLRPGDALEEMAEGRLQLWPPTAATLQQLEHATSFEQVRDRLSTGTLGSVHVESVALDTTRIEMPAAGGVAGQTVDAYLVGRRSFVLVDPGDPTGPALDRAVALASELGGAIHAIALTHVDADHSAGAEVLAERLGIPILVGPGGGRPLPYETRELADGERIDLGDVPLTVVATPGPRPEHVAFVVGDGTAVIAGDLDGRRGSRMLPGPVDDVSLRASRDRLARLAPGAPRLAGHRDDGAIIAAGGHDR
jgi:glyoxylase-like metal-dependent hydrolase (beta-lactamase superfamily II)/8-oxo-dGTP pyrophosphatase MutT (NUDIX family)